MKKETRNKYTLIYHRHICNHWYNIEMERVSLSDEKLTVRRKDCALHFVVEGWPEITFPDGHNYFVEEET